LNKKNEESKKRAVEEAIKTLKKGDILALYPEGTRSRTGEIQKEILREITRKTIEEIIDLTK